MKKIVLFLALGLRLFGFEAGKEYVVLQDPIPNLSNSVIEIFSYDCPFCYKFDEQVIKKMVNDAKSNFDFMQLHIPQKAEFGEIATELFASFMALDILNNTSPIKDNSSIFQNAKSALFNAYHNEKVNFGSSQNSEDNETFINFLLTSANVSKTELDNAKKLDDFINFHQLFKDDRIYEIAKIQGIPAFVVNGKYLIKTNSVKSYENFLELINELLKMN